MNQYFHDKIGDWGSNNILSKATIDLITINSSTPSDKYINFYSTLYTTVITVNSFCSKSSKDPENDDCQLKKTLDLNVLEENNLRRNEENIEDIMRDAILPICFIEHTDTNQILSLNCPETLAPNFKDDMLQAFATIKPRSMKGFDFDKNYVNTIVEEKDDKIYINSFDKVCLEPNFDENKNVECDLIKSIITDKEGNLISCMEVTKLFELLSSNFYLSPRQMVGRLRLQEASELLLTTDKSVEEIANELMFVTPNYFISCFYHHFRQTPKDYRKSKAL